MTVVVCAAVLLLLARLRFPDAPPIADAATPPLERLASRASYDALAGDIERVESIIAPNLIVLRVTVQGSTTPFRLDDVLARPESSSFFRHVPALRVSTDTAAASLDPDARIEGIVGAARGEGAAVVALDPVRRVARIRVPDAPIRELSQLPLTSLSTPAYVVAVEGMQAGVTLRPVFLGRGDRFHSARWARPLLPLGGIAVSPGALLFSLAGEFIGTVVSENGASAIADARDVFDTVTRLATASPVVPADLGIAVQSLTHSLTVALSVPQGVVVSEVDPEGAAMNLLEPADVITAVDEVPIGNPEEFLLGLASRSDARPIRLAIVRQGEPRTVTVPFPTPIHDRPSDTRLSLILEQDHGTRIETTGGGVHLQPGDLITRAGNIQRPTPAQVRQWLATPAPSGYTTLVVERVGRLRVVAVPVDGRHDDGR
jgi:hypothetical protein